MDEYIKTAEYNISQKTYEKSILVKKLIIGSKL
jgi:hypothetical protein